LENKKLYVGNLNFKAEKEDIFDLFGEFGEVVGVHIVERDGLRKGFAFVEFATAEAAEAAKNSLDGKEFMTRTMRIDFARPRENNNRERRPYRAREEF